MKRQKTSPLAHTACSIGNQYWIGNGGGGVEDSSLPRGLIMSFSDAHLQHLHSIDPISPLPPPCSGPAAVERAAKAEGSVGED